MAFVRLNKRHVMLCYVIMPFQISLNFAHPEVVNVHSLIYCSVFFLFFSSCIRLMCDEYEHVTITSVQFPFSAYFLDGIIRKWTISYCQRGGYVMLFSSVLATFSPCKCFRCGPYYQLWLSTGWTNFDSAYTDANILRSTAVPCKQYASFLRPDAGAAAGPSNPHWQTGLDVLAIVPLCRGTGTPFDEHRRPMAPSKFLDVRVTEKILLSLWPLAYAPGRDDY